MSRHPRTPPDTQQHALHVLDYYAAAALARLRAMGACGRQTRKLTESEFDYSQESLQNGDGEIY